MAIKPTDLRNSTDIKEAADHIEQEIDRALLRQSTSFSGQAIYISVHSSPGSAVIEELRRRYLAAGWASFNLESDQREGSYYVLKA